VKSVSAELGTVTTKVYKLEIFIRFLTLYQLRFKMGGPIGALFQIVTDI
jgi:hypothetical protein